MTCVSVFCAALNYLSLSGLAGEYLVKRQGTASRSSSLLPPVLLPLSFRTIKIRVPFPFPVRYGVCVANSLSATATAIQNFISATVMSLQKTDTAPVLP